jgi:hypothetical protein
MRSCSANHLTVIFGESCLLFSDVLTNVTLSWSSRRACVNIHSFISAACVCFGGVGARSYDAGSEFDTLTDCFNTHWTSKGPYWSKVSTSETH